MLKVSIIAVGKAAAFYAEGVREYQKRLRPLCRFEVLELPEEPLDEKKASPALVKAALAREGGRILAAVPKAAVLAALCVEGKQLTSEEFSALLEEEALRGAPAVAFAIGSSWGLAPEVKAAAAYSLSLGKMTLPHQLARLVLAEQIYRAMMIRTGNRYHK